MGRILEKQHVELPVLRWFKKTYPGVRVTKMSAFGSMRSWPDRCFWIPGGKPFLIEFKKPGEEPTKLQTDTIEDLRSDGYDVEVHDDPEEAKRAIRKRMERTGRKVRL